MSLTHRFHDSPEGHEATWCHTWAQNFEQRSHFRYAKRAYSRAIAAVNSYLKTLRNEGLSQPVDFRNSGSSSGSPTPDHLELAIQGLNNLLTRVFFLFFFFFLKIIISHF